MIRAETGKARLTRARDAVSRHMSLPDLGDQEHTIALTGNRTANKLLGPVQLRRVDQRHPEGKAGAQRFFFSGRRMFFLSKTPRALAEGRYDGAVPDLDRASEDATASPGSTPGSSIRPHRKHRAGREERRCAKSGEVASVQQSVVHVFRLMRYLQRTYRRRPYVTGRDNDLQ